VPTSFPKEGVFDLAAEDIFKEAVRLYEEFFSMQSPLTAYRVSVTLYHLAEWVTPGGNDKDFRNCIDAADPNRQRKAKLLADLHGYCHYEVLRSFCNNSKRFKLQSAAFEKSIEHGFLVGRSVVGESLGQANLAVVVDGQSIWLREVFSHVLHLHAAYFKSQDVE
jgi:hypothetical protein